MVFLGGDCTEITCTHPTLGAFRYQPISKESATTDKGGLRSNDDDNSVTGMGQNIPILNMNRWSFEIAIAADFKSDYESGSLNAMAGDPQDGVWTFSHISGAVWKGTGRPVGDVKGDTDKAQIKLKVAGGGTLDEIA